MKSIISNNKGYFTRLLVLFTICIYPLVFVSKPDSFFFVNGHYSAWTDFVFKYWTHLGSGYVYAVVLLYLLLKKDYRGSIILLGVTILQTIISTLLKQVIFPDAWRPVKELADIAGRIHLVEGVKTHSYHSFPSGHTATAFATATLLALIVKNKRYSLIFLFLAVGVAWSRMYLAQHFLIDVYFGALTGVVSTLAMYYWLVHKTPGFLRKTMK